MKKAQVFSKLINQEQFVFQQYLRNHNIMPKYQTGLLKEKRSKSLKLAMWSLSSVHFMKESLIITLSFLLHSISNKHSQWKILFWNDLSNILIFHLVFAYQIFVLNRSLKIKYYFFKVGILFLQMNLKNWRYKILSV